MAISIASYFSDPDGDALAYSASGLPGGLSLNSSTGIITGTPTESGAFSVTITATDPGALSVTDTFILTIAPPANQAPVVDSPIPDQSGTVGVAI